MKALYSIALLFITVVAFVSCSIRHSEPITGKVVNTEDIRIKNGEVLYMTYCQKCHPMGEGGLGPAVNTMNVPRFVKRFQARHGLGVMPYFKKDQISKKDLHDISHYMGALKKL
jgi:mono/diheme cytochrome c family protein